MATARALSRCRERLDRLGRSALDGDSLRLEAIAELRRVVGFDRWCFPLADPDTLVAHSGLAEHNFGPGVPRSLELEYSDDRFMAKHLVASRPEPVSHLSAETCGDLARSPRWDEVMRPAGIGDIGIVACRDAFGCWGWLEAYRDGADRPFAPEDLALLAELGPRFGTALRRGAVFGGPARAAAPPAPPGVLVLDCTLRPVSWTAGARAWIDALPAARLFETWGMLPSAVYPVATLARAGSRADLAHALLRTVDDRWLTIEAAPLEGEPGRAVAVSLRAASMAEIFQLLCRVYALTRRERELVALVVDGLDTKGIAARLVISPHTVQDHLKSVFAKLGVHSRRALLAKLTAAPAN